MNLFLGTTRSTINVCRYEDQLFEQQVIQAIRKKDPRPLFFFWALHIVHAPLQVPKAYLDKFAAVADWRRRRYLAMVNYMDTAVSRVVGEMKMQDMYDNSLIVFSAGAHT